MDCSICQEACEGDSCDCSLLPCGHAFHSKCLVPWLWGGNLNCPNCRFQAHSDDEDEENDSTNNINLEALLEEVRSIRRRRTQTLRQNLRRARMSEPPRALIRHTRARAKMIDAIKLTRTLVQNRSERVRRHERELQFEYDELYRKYRREIAQARSEFKERAESDIKELNRVKCLLRRQHKAFQKADDALRTQVF